MMCFQFHIWYVIKCLYDQVTAYTLVLEVSKIKRELRKPACSQGRPSIPWEKSAKGNTIHFPIPQAKILQSTYPRQTQSVERTQLAPCWVLRWGDRGQEAACQEGQEFFTRFVLNVLNFNTAMPKTILLVPLGRIFVGINFSKSLLCVKYIFGYSWSFREFLDTVGGFREFLD